MSELNEMTKLEAWLKQATRRLSRDSAAQVRTEIREHYESAREAAMNAGATADEADRLAVTTLGDAKAANGQYQKVLLTSAEARMLREGNWEARAVCSRKWLVAMPVAALVAAAACFMAGATYYAWALLVGGIGTGFLFTAPFLPVYTPARGRAFRIVKFVAMLGILGLAFGLRWSWLIGPCLWPIVWIEWTRDSIRRKLPVAEWPKQLYL